MLKLPGFIRSIILEKKAKKLQRTVRVLNLKEIKTALIIYNATNKLTEEDVRNFARFLKEDGIKVDTIGYFKRKNQKEALPVNELGYHYFDKKICNFLGIPVNQELNKLIEKTHDLLIDLNFESNFALRYYSTLSNSGFKIGKTGNYIDTVGDLTISTDNHLLGYFIEQLKVYLKMINSR